MAEGEKILTKKRESNIELLRIISMILIVMHHYYVHSNFTFSTGISFNKFMIQALSIGGKVGVNIFILITGYFMIESKFRMKKFVKLILEIWSYSVIIMVLACTFDVGEININTIVKSIFPITYSLHWFTTTYILLYILSPFINQFIKNIGRNTFLKLLIILLVMQVIIPTFMGADLNFSNLIWFTTVYMIGGYIHLYDIPFLNTKKSNIKAIIFCVTIILLSIITIDLLAIKIEKLDSYATYFSGINKLPAVILSISVFCLFKDMKIKESRLINSVASSTFGIYLIHDNSIISPIIWQRILNGATLQNSPYLIVHFVISVILVFCISILTDKIRELTIEKWLLKIVDKIAEKYKAKYVRMTYKLKQLTEI